VLTAIAMMLWRRDGYSTPFIVSDLRDVRLTLYQRDDCHLCDLALDVLAQAHLPDFDSIFIDGDAELEAHYGERVPVLRTSAGRELGWPFDAASVSEFIGR
jgi:hypothetical protein